MPSLVRERTIIITLIMYAHYTVNVACTRTHATTAWRNAKKWAWQGRLHLKNNHIAKIN